MQRSLGFLLVSLTFFHSASAFHMIEEMKVIVNKSNLLDILAFSFQNHYCAQVSIEDSFVAYQVYGLVHNSPSCPTLLNGRGAKEMDCNFRIYISNSVKGLIKLLDKNPLRRLEFLILLSDKNNTKFEEFLKKGTRGYVENSKGVLVNYLSTDVIFKYSPIQKTFKSGSIENINTNERVRKGQKYENFKGKKLRVGTFNCSVNSQIGPLDEHGRPKWIGGVEMKFFDEISQKLNFTYEVVVPREGYQLGTIDKDGRWSGGLMELIGRREVDVAFCGIWFTGYNLRSSLSVTTPIDDLCLTFLVPRPLLFSQMGLGLFSSFQWEVWAYAAAQTIFLTWVLQGLTYLALKTSELDKEIRGFVRFEKCFLILWAILCNNAPKSLSFYGPLRHVLSWYALSALLLNASFSSSLIAHLTRALYASPLDSFEKLVDRDYIWCAQNFPAVGSIFNLDDKWEKEWTKKFCRADPKGQCKYIKDEKTNYAIFILNYKGGVILQQDLPCKKDLRGYEMMPKCISKFYTGFLLQQKSPYTKIFSDYITRYQESGVFIKEYRHEIHALAMREKYVYDSRISITKQKIDRVKLKLSNILSTFYLFSLGIYVSCMGFIGELLWHNRGKVFACCGLFKNARLRRIEDMASKLRRRSSTYNVEKTRTEN